LHVEAFMKSINILFLSAIVLFPLCACDKNPVSPELLKLKNSYFPLQMGNSWTFEETFYDTTQKYREVTYSITKSVKINGKEYFAFDNWPDFIQYPLMRYFDMDSVFIRNDQNGNVMMIIDEKEFMFIKFNSSLVATIINIVELYDKIAQLQSMWQYMIYEIDRILTTENREYVNGYRLCFLEFNAVGSQRDVIFFPGFGIVRMDYIAYSMDWKLKDAIINGKKVEKIVKYPDL
jgi:hypothetical protein